MRNLSEVLLAPGRRNQVVNDCVALVEGEVASKGGLTGIAVKGAFAVVKAVKPGIVREAVESLLDEFVTALDPYYADFVGGESSALELYFQSRGNEIANALLSVTDRRASTAKNPGVRRAYDKLRPTGVKHTEAAVPAIARLIRKHVG